ncbi:MAG: hypothetical protein J2P37_34070 [Ktedonobacteraceae bacterium]|nr:hypothetical protein [Ktedonobacteraceae bacterium]
MTMKQLQARQVGQWTRQARDRPPTQLASSTALALLGLRLSRHQYRLMELLLSHPLLSSTNLAALLSVQESSVRQYLSEMRSLYCLETEYLAADATTPRWRLSSHGLRLLALRYRLSLRAIATRHEEYEHPYPVYVQKGLEHLRRNAAHTIGVYAFFTRLATDAASPQHRLLWWETGYAREQAYYAFSRPAWTWEKPHGIGEYQIGTQRVRFWFEWQDSWNSWQYIQSLLTGYATYIRSAEWRREGYVLPVLLLVCPDGVRERHMQQIVRDALGLLHPTPLILTTTVEMFNTCGPLAAIWQLVSFMSKDASTPIRRVFYDMSMEGNIRPPLDRGG